VPAVKKKLAKKRTDGRGALGRPARRSDSELDDDAIKALVPGGLASSFVKSKLHDKALAIAGLGEPSDWDGDMPELPNDIAGEDHDTLSNLHAQFTNAYSTSIWYASRYYVEADAYEEIAEYLEDVALLDANESNEGKRKAQARTDERVVAARAMQHTSYNNYVRFRDLASTLDRRAKAVSRIGGFIGDEAENEDTRPLRSSTRGKAVAASKGRAKGATRRLSRR
jgi:hypothetical protein